MARRRAGPERNRDRNPPRQVRQLRPPCAPRSRGGGRVIVVGLLLAFVACSIGALFLLFLVDPRAVPPLTGTAVLVLTIAALGVAMFR
ncbi:hypothetical protein SSBG_02562 [Streptomyces sp. SPB074]|nr:hypothetical protein SSBG_02562 [Streptomyces sp. SPB074]